MKAKLSTMLSALVLVLCGGCLTTFVANNSNVYADETPEKTYTYALSQVQNKIVIKGEYSDHTEYTLSDGTDFANIAEIIDEDREGLGFYYDAKICFNDINVFDSYIALEHGNYTLSGEFSGLGYSTYGLIYVNGANVVFENAKFTNNGLSYLVRNDGDGNLTFNGGTFSSNGDTIYSTNEGNLIVNEGNIVSLKSSAINFEPSSVATLFIDEAENKDVAIVGKDKAAIYVKNAEFSLGNCLIQNYYGTAIKLEQTNLTLIGEPLIFSAGIDIESDYPIYANGYEDEKIDVKFTGEISSGETIAIYDANVENFALTNVGYTILQSGDNIVINKTSRVIYNDSRDFIYTMPYDSKKYVANEQATIKFVEENDIKDNVTNRFNFLGWSTTEGSLTPEFTKDGVNTFVFEEENLILYAVWQPITFTITYQGLEGISGINDNPTEYNTDQEIHFNVVAKDFYVFIGWTTEKQLSPVVNFVLETGNWGDLVLTANWNYQKYDITYNNVDANIVKKLGLKTQYTINDYALEINTDKFLVLGYSTYGVYYDELQTVEVDEKIYFKPDEQYQNSVYFNMFNTIGSTINLYVDMKKYFAEGDGSQLNPYIINTATQLQTLMTGSKVSSSKNTYVKLNKNMILFDLQNDYTGFSKIIFDGNGKTLGVYQLYQQDDFYAVFPKISNSTIKNLNIISSSAIEVTVESNANVGCVFGEIKNVTLENVNANVSVKVECVSGPAIIKVGGVVVNAQNSTINNVNNLGNISVNVAATDGAINVYASGIVGGDAQNSKILNCQSAGKIEVIMPNTTFETRSYISTLANLGENNKVYNCFANGQIIYSQLANNIAYVSGALIIFDENNTAKNVAWIGSIKINGAASKVYRANFVGVNKDYCTTENLWLPINFVGLNADKNLNIMNSVLERYSNEVNCTLNQWFFNENDKINFEPLYKVTFISNGIADKKIMYLTSLEDGENIVFMFDTEKYKFVAWEDQNGTQIDWKNANSSAMTVYGHYELWDNVIATQQMYLAIGALLIVLGVLLIMLMFDCKKSVKFVLDGKVVAKQRLARKKRIKAPKEFSNMWFFDLEGKKPLTNQKMPCHPIKLFATTDEKQEKYESYWNEQERLKQQAITNKKQEKQNSKQQKIDKKLSKKLLKQKKIDDKNQKKIDNKKQKENELKAKQEAKQLKKEQKKEIKPDNSKVTVIKKEIKVLDNNENANDEDNKN